MDLKAFLKKYWFVCIVLVLLIVFVGAYAASSYKNREVTVNTLTKDGKDVIYSINGDTYYYADDLYEDLYDSYGDRIGYLTFYNAMVDKAVDTTTELNNYAASWATNILQQDDNDTINYYMLNYGFKGMDGLTDYCLSKLKESELRNDLYLNQADKNTQPVIDKENPRFVYHILISVADVEETTDADGNVIHKCNPTDEEKTKLDECLAKIAEDNVAFGEIASEYSDDPGSAKNGGSIGLVYESNKNGYVTEFAEASMKLNDGEISDPVETQFGYHIIKVATPSIEDLLSDQDFYNLVLQNDPNLLLNTLIEKVKDNKFEIVDENVKKYYDNELEAK